MNTTSKLGQNLTVLLLLTLATTAGAYTTRPAAWRPQRAQAPPTYTAAGVYTGIVGDQVSIDSASYRLTPGTLAYVIGVGLVPMMSVPIGSHEFATGSGNPETGAIGSLIVRPADEDRAGNVDVSTSIHVRSIDADVPR